MIFTTHTPSLTRCTTNWRNTMNTFFEFPSIVCSALYDFYPLSQSLAVYFR